MLSHGTKWHELTLCADPAGEISQFPDAPILVIENWELGNKFYPGLEVLAQPWLSDCVIEKRDIIIHSQTLANCTLANPIMEKYTCVLVFPRRRHTEMAATHRKAVTRSLAGLRVMAGD